jgi:sugar lactone lactonase YvrE
MKTLTAEVVFRNPSELGEGSLWDDVGQRLFWVDIYQQKLCVFDPRNRSNLAYHVGEDVGTVVVASDSEVIVALRTGLFWFDLRSGELAPLTPVEGLGPTLRCNDGKCDPRGRFWVGTMVEGKTSGGAALYCLDTNLQLETRIEGVTISNGLAWSGDTRRFFYIDTPTQRIDVYDFDAERGTLHDRRVVIEIPKSVGSPDGMTIDERDKLWVALWGGGKVICVDPSSGSIEAEVRLPVPNVTSCAFGGPELDELYITTARSGMAPESLEAHPLAGSLFRARVASRGVPAQRFRGGRT